MKWYFDYFRQECVSVLVVHINFKMLIFIPLPSITHIPSSPITHCSNEKLQIKLTKPKKKNGKTFSKYLPTHFHLMSSNNVYGKINTSLKIYFLFGNFISKTNLDIIHRFKSFVSVVRPLIPTLYPKLLVEKTLHLCTLNIIQFI